jgi:2-hydroxycyclohexanecarboxyl-CoA dehydrogenase
MSSPQPAPRAQPPSHKVAIVTGGASGIGRATCEQLSAAGYPVGVLDIDAAAADEVASELRTSGGRSVAARADVTDPAAMHEAVEKVRAELGAVNILVTSAGLAAWDDFDTITPERWRQVIDVNLTGTFNACQAALPDMLAARWGRIVTISSSSAQRGSPKMAHYAAAKGGVIVLTKSLAREYAPAGITVNSIPPSAIETPMQHQAQATGKLPTDEVIARSIPLGHLGTPADIAAAVVFLVSDAAGFITGQVLGVNGGSVL